MAYWNSSVQTFFLPHAKLITWLSALKIIIAAFCSANFVCDENNSKFLFFCLEAYIWPKSRKDDAVLAMTNGSGLRYLGPYSQNILRLKVAPNSPI